MIGRATACALSLLLGACAADQVRIDDAAVVSTQAKAVVSRGQTYFTALQTRRRDVNVALVASDPSCAWGHEVWVATIYSLPPPGQPLSPYCAPPGTPGFSRLDLRTPIRVQPALKLLDALTAYEKALTQVLEGDKDSAAISITDAMTTLIAVDGDIDRIAGGGFALPAPLTGQLKAGADLFSTLDQLRKTNLKAKAVASVAKPFDASKFAGSLKDAVAQFNTLEDQNSAGQLVTTLAIVDARERATASYDTRHAHLAALAAAQDDLANPNDRIKAFDTEIDKLVVTQKTLVDALNGNYDEATRKKIASENRKSIVDILGKIAAIFPAI